MFAVLLISKSREFAHISFDFVSMMILRRPKLVRENVGTVVPLLSYGVSGD